MANGEERDQRQAPRRGHVHRPDVPLQAARHVIGKPHEPEVEEDREEGRADDRRVVDPEDDAAAQESELVVSEPLDPDEGREEERREEEPRLPRIQEQRHEAEHGAEKPDAVQDKDGLR